MKRRDFLKQAGVSTAVLPFAIGGFNIRAFGASPIFDALTAPANCDDRILVLVQLMGGNDGLNTVVPLDQYAIYHDARANIAHPEKEILKISDHTGLHPKLTGFQHLFKAGKLAIIQNVGSVTPNFSHFRSTDIWNSGCDYDQYVTTGWLGRYLEHQYPHYPEGYPNTTMPDPVAIQVGSMISPALDGTLANMGMAFTNPKSFYNINDYSGNVPQAETKAKSITSYIRSTGDQIAKFAVPVKAAAAKATNKSTLWQAGVPIAEQLKIVSLLIAGGLKSKVYIVTQPGFDTHSVQPEYHGRAIEQVSSAIEAFQNDLELNGVADRVMGMTFSEFGRRIVSNSGFGTDHGTAAPLFVFGKNVKGGIIGANPVLPPKPTYLDNLDIKVDFRSIYSTMLKDWFCADESLVRKILFKDFEHIPVLDV